MTDGQATVVANPDDSGERVGALVADAHGKVFVGDWAADSLVFIEDGKATVVEVGAEFSNIVAIPDGTFAVVGTDGTLRIFDAHGHETATFEVIAPWTKGKGHGALAPSLAAGQNAGANTVWVSEPATGKVHAVDLFAKEIASADVEGNPGSVAVTNAKP